jgi:hypothetical protein
LYRYAYARTSVPFSVLTCITPYRDSMDDSELHTDCALVEAYIEDQHREDIDPEMVVQHTQDCVECFTKIQEFWRRIKEESDLHL